MISRVLDGDVEAFGVLVDRYQDQLARYAAHMTGSVDEAADIVQDGLVRAYRSLGKCVDRDRFKGWLFRIVTNLCKTHLARRGRRKTDPISNVTVDIQSPDTADRDTEESELRRKVREALQRLALDQREAMVLRYIEGLSLEEMSEALGASVSALKMRLSRGRGALRTMLGDVAP